MATEEQIKERQAALFNNYVAGFAKGLYELFGDSAFAMSNTIGSELLADMEKELGLKVAGTNAQEILTEIQRLLVDEYGMSVDAVMTVADDQISMKIEKCQMWQTAEKLSAADVPPFVCLPMMMASSALRKRLGLKSKFTGIKREPNHQICSITFSIN